MTEDRESGRDARLLVVDNDPRTLSGTSRQLRERVKELNCLYGISKLIQDTDLSLREILQGTLERIPPAWQYPEITCARIVLDDQTYETPGFRETIWKQSCGIRVRAEMAGALERAPSRSAISRNGPGRMRGPS